MSNEKKAGPATDRQSNTAFQESTTDSKSAKSVLSRSAEPVRGITCQQCGGRCEYDRSLDLSFCARCGACCS